MINPYWEYAGTRYKAKIKAIEASGGDVNNITFSAFDSFFYLYDWKIEPKESFEELLLERALQIRDSYSYIKLWYSGGHDSTLMLNTFIKHNIHIDEIVVYRFAINDNFDNLSNTEVDTYTLPFMKTLQNVLINTKFTIYDFSREYFDKHLSDKWLHTKSNLDLRHMYIPKFNGKNYCHLMGDMDPEVYFKDGEWFSIVYDTNNLAEKTGVRNVELFYTSAQLPKLHSKQLHMVKNYLKNSDTYYMSSVSNDYKNIVRKVVRKGSLFPETAILAKARHVSLLDNVKTRQMLIKADKKQRDALYSLCNTKINGKKLVNLFRGYSAGTLCLGM
jgi:hypothetical protein